MERFFPGFRYFYVPRTLRPHTTKHLVKQLAFFIDLLPPDFAARELCQSLMTDLVHVPKELTSIDIPSVPTLVQ